MAEDYQKYLDPKVLSKIHKLELAARLVVEGFIGGLHKSPFFGSSVEFAEHREYVPGDDTRHLDWRVYAKTDRFYIKQYEEETNQRVYLVLDTSESMRYASEKVTKFDYAAYIAASIAHLVLKQRDSVGLTLFDEGVIKEIPPLSQQNHISQICHEIQVSTRQKKTNMGDVLHRCVEKFTRRGIVVIISDMFENEDKLIAGVQHLRHRGHDVIMLQVLDRYELTFPFEELTQFIGMEGYPTLTLDPRPLRKAYIEEITGAITKLRRSCTRNRIDFETICTDQMLDVALAKYLATRQSMIDNRSKR